jgi:serine/threonine-protein kinase
MTIRKFGRYEVKRPLGQGGMAIVYLAYDPEMGREVAVKILPTHLTNDPHFFSRFQREVKTIAKLEHPCIVPVYDCGAKENQPYIVMRYMSGGTLLNFLKKKNSPVDPHELLPIIDRVARALDFAHAHNVIHRDLKPGNILFDNQGLAYLSDFGIAKVVETATAFAGSGPIGTPSYMSPEQGMGAENLDGRSDVYSLGIIIFEALTGKLPYQANTPVALLMQHLTKEIPSVCQFRSNLSSNYEIVIRQTLAKTPDGRYAKAEDLVEDLVKIIRGEWILPRAELQGDVTGQISTILKAEKLGQQKALTPPKFTSRLKLGPVLLGIGLIITLIVGSGLAIVNGVLGNISLTPTQILITQPTEASPQIPMVFTPTTTQTATPSSTPDQEATTQALMAAIFATQTASVPTATNTPIPTDTTAPTNTPLPDTPTSSPTPLPPPTKPPPPPSPTPTTTSIPTPKPGGFFSFSASVNGRYQTYVYNLNNSASQPIFSHDGVVDADIQPGAHRLAYHWADSGRGGIWRMDLDGNNQQMITTFTEDRAPNWSADGTGIFFSSTREGDHSVHQVYRINADGSGGEIRFLTITGRDPVELTGGQLLFAGWLSYSPGACGVIFYQWRRTSGAGDIVGTEGRVSDQCSDYRPDAVGNQVVFMRQENGQFDVWQNQAGFDVQGSAINITPNTPGSEILPVFSPDGKWIAYASNQGGVWGVYAMKTDGSEKSVPLLEFPSGVDFSDWNLSRLSWAN